MKISAGLRHPAMLIWLPNQISGAQFDQITAAHLLSTANYVLARVHNHILHVARAIGQLRQPGDYLRKAWGPPDKASGKFGAVPQCAARCAHFRSEGSRCGERHDLSSGIDRRCGQFEDRNWLRPIQPLSVRIREAHPPGGMSRMAAHNCRSATVHGKISMMKRQARQLAVLTLKHKRHQIDRTQQIGCQIVVEFFDT
jgi:hypothetical protein